jgi:4-hydroxy-tetrahydrodipicolinate synthase
MTQRIRGVLAPVVTPFKADLSPDRERLIAHCKWLLSQNCGLAVFGTNSEANSLSVDERSALLDELVAAGVDPSRMMPGTGCCSITETVRLTAQAVKHGCAGVLMLPPFYYKRVSEEGLYRFFSEVVHRVGDLRLKIYLYHIPPVAVVGITTGLVERLLAAFPDAIAGMKDSSGDWNNTKTFLDAFNESRHGESSTGTSFDVFVGSESFLLANMRNGGAGTISATANVHPAAIYRLYAACSKPRMDTNQHESGKREHGTSNAPARSATHSVAGGEHRTSNELDLEEQQQRLNIVREVFAKYPMIAALKQGLAIYRKDPAWATVRPPLVELSAGQASNLQEALAAIGFAMPGDY